MAEALSRMGATRSSMRSVDVDRFGAELEAVVKKITALQPDVDLASNTYGGKGLEATAMFIFVDNFMYMI